MTEEAIEPGRTISSCSTCAPMENIAAALMVSCHIGLAVGLGRHSMGIGASRGLLDLEVLPWPRAFNDIKITILSGYSNMCLRVLV